MQIICFGDSNTYGYDPRSWFGGRYPADARWPDLLARNTGRTVRNEGMNGRSIPTGGFLSLPHGDVLVVMLGSNDLLCGASPEEAAGRMEAFLQPLVTAYRQILLVAPPPMQPGEWVTEPRLLTDSARLADAYRQLALRLGIGFADAGEWGVELAYDGVHFSEVGHRAFAAGILTALQT